MNTFIDFTALEEKVKSGSSLNEAEELSLVINLSDKDCFYIYVMNHELSPKAQVELVKNACYKTLIRYFATFAYERRTLCLEAQIELLCSKPNLLFHYLMSASCDLDMEAKIEMMKTAHYEVILSYYDYVSMAMHMSHSSLGELNYEALKLFACRECCYAAQQIYEALHGNIGKNILKYQKA